MRRPLVNVEWARRGEDRVVEVKGGQASSEVMVRENRKARRKGYWK